MNHSFILLWATQSLSALGSAMTSFALIVWSYEQEGSALTTALLSVCSYAPYVIFSMFAGALSDRWNKKYTMLFCDSLAALSTIFILILLRSEGLKLWHLYMINGFNGLMNTVQQPASDVAVTLLTPKDQYQRAAGLRSFSNSLITVLAPVCAAALFSFGGLDAVILVDLCTFFIAFTALWGFIYIPQKQLGEREHTSLFTLVRDGLSYLSANRGILNLILFLAAINLIASMYNAALPAMLLSRNGGSKTALGLVNTCTGLANVAGSILVSFAPAPRSRVRAICGSLFFAMSTENLLLALGNNTFIWCLGAVLGWLFIPVMNTNMDVLFRSCIPAELQGRVYSARNTLQFFTIPAGYLLGGFLVDHVFEPLMARQKETSLLIRIFGQGKGSGCAFLFLILAMAGVLTCVIFSRNRDIWALENKM